MKYLKVFNNDAEYQQFKNGDDYITPNICLIKENDIINIQGYRIILTFPIYLKEGDNEDNGRLLYSYLFDKKQPVDSGPIELSDSDVIFVDGSLEEKYGNKIYSFRYLEGINIDDYGIKYENVIMLYLKGNVDGYMLDANGNLGPYDE